MFKLWKNLLNWFNKKPYSFKTISKVDFYNQISSFLLFDEYEISILNNINSNYTINIYNNRYIYLSKTEIYKNIVETTENYIYKASDDYYLVFYKKDTKVKNIHSTKEVYLILDQIDEYKIFLKNLK